MLQEIGKNQMNLFGWSVRFTISQKIKDGKKRDKGVIVLRDRNCVP